MLRIFTSKKADYGQPKSLFDGLQKEESGAIQYLYARIRGKVAQIGNQYRISEEDVDELISDCITTLILKIREGKYVFQGFDPATFAIEIAKMKVMHIRRKLDRNQSAELTDQVHSIPAVDEDFTSREAVDLVAGLLAKIPENCQKLIRLKYLEEWSDKEVIEQNLTQYTTVDALKNHRSKCMKTLVESAQGQK